MIREDVINFNKLRKSQIPYDFVKRHNGEWSHMEWAEFCSYITEQGFTPIDFDKVGLLLESLKEKI